MVAAIWIGRDAFWLDSGGLGEFGRTKKCNAVAPKGASGRYQKVHGVACGSVWRQTLISGLLGRPRSTLLGLSFQKGNQTYERIAPE